MGNLDHLYDLDDRHQAFENHEHGLLVSSAGPGTGKTYSFLRRVAALVGRDTEPSSICYLTFIKEITRAFLTDYVSEFGVSVGADNHPRISTLHSLACRIIRNRGFTVGLDGPLSFVGLSDVSPQSTIFLEDLLPLVSGSGVTTLPQLRNVLGSIKSQWRTGLDPTRLAPPLPITTHGYLVLARAYRLVDWDQAIVLAHSFYMDPHNRQRWLSDLQHYFIDEYQDFNPAEQALLASISQNCASMAVVGDPNQSIYGRRSALPGALLDLGNSPNADTVSLLRSRRCRSNILVAVNTLMRVIDPASAPLVPDSRGGDIQCYRFKSSKAELDFLTRHLLDLLAQIPSDASPNCSVACLFPDRKSLGFYFASLSETVPSYRRSAEPDPSRARLGLHLQLVCNPRQRFVQRHILQEYTDIKPRHKREMVRQILLHDTPPTETLSGMLEAGRLQESAANQAREFIEYCNRLQTNDPETIASALSGRLGYDHGLLRTCTTDLLQQLQSVDQDEAIDTFCDRLLPQTATPLEDPHSVQFLTIHASKGLTRHSIIMPGLEDAWLPANSTGADLEERRRLFYVAITRATDNVLITYPTNRARGDPLNYPVDGRSCPCRFVAEAGIHHSYHP